MVIPVSWLNFHPRECQPKQHWDTALFQELILKGYPEFVPDGERAKALVVMIPGRFHAAEVDLINVACRHLNGVVFVVHSDEESLFPWWELDHPNMRRWVMTPHPDTKPTEGVRFIGEGWSPNTPGNATMAKELVGTYRQYDIGFAGQVTHERRRQCVAAAAESGRFRWLTETKSFAAGMDRGQYLARMSETKFAPCPSGPVTADSFRVYEALEAGCVPILDCVDGQGRDAMGFWKLILGEHPIPLIRDWSFLPALVETLLPEWETLQAEVKAWWSWRKDQWVADMAEDVKAIS